MAKGLTALELALRNDEIYEAFNYGFPLREIAAEHKLTIGRIKQILNTEAEYYDEEPPFSSSYSGWTPRRVVGRKKAVLPDSDFVKREYLAGTSSSKELAIRCGVSVETLRKRLREMGVALHPRGRKAK